MKTNAFKFNIAMGLILASSVTGNTLAASSNQRLPISYSQLKQFNIDQGLTSESYPQGVPTSYGWGAHPLMQAGNVVPAGFTAITGWAHVFWASGVTSSADYVQMKDFKTLICTITNGVHVWTLLQQGDFAGSQFNADYVDNINSAPPYFVQTAGSGVATFGIDSGDKVYHYWYKQGRVTLPSTSICGTLSIQQARTVTKASGGTSAGGTGSYVIGIGGDYWLTTTSAWDYLTTNTGINIGRFKIITGKWVWYGVSTASDTDLYNLYQYGYATTPEAAAAAPTTTTTTKAVSSSTSSTNTATASRYQNIRNLFN